MSKHLGPHPRRARHRSLLLAVWACAISALGCHRAARGVEDAGGPPPLGRCEQPFKLATDHDDIGLRINEVLASNDGAAIDAQGETDDFLELVNTAEQPISLAGLYITDSENAAALPERTLAPGERLLLWADDQTSQGLDHLPFKLDKEGEQLGLWRGGCTQLDALKVPELEANQTFARFPDGSGEPTRCRYASAGRANGASCEPPAPPALTDDVPFQRYQFPSPFPASSDVLQIAALTLAPYGAVELANDGTTAVALTGMSLRLASFAPGAALPASADGVEVPLGATTLAPGARLRVPLADAALAPILSGAAREGVLTLFADAGQRVVDRLDFMALPDQATLARTAPRQRTYQLCSAYSSANASCTPLATRPVADRLRALNTPADFAALARGGTEVGNAAVKFIVDMEAGDNVQLLSSERWALHYTFIREQIYNQPALDRCDPVAAAQFQQGWYEFSVREYFRVTGRRFLLGTLVAHANGLHTVEFAVGDAINAELMKRAFLAVVARTPDPTAWALRPQDAIQLAQMRSLDGQLPIVGTNAPFRDMVYQPLTTAVGYGTLRFIPASELEGAQLGSQVVVVTDDVPNDIPFVGGLITEAFQAPLAHVNVLSEARGTPNMALRKARTDPRVAPLLGRLVRLEVQNGDFELREASAEEAAAFYTARMPKGPRLSPAHDDSVRGVQPLSQHGIASATVIGSKAAQLAELAKVNTLSHGCPSTTLPLNTPVQAFAIPFAHYVEHFARSGAETKLKQLLEDPTFQADSSVRAQRLAELRRMVLDTPVDPELLREVEAAVSLRFGEGDVRLRSSSNMEDLDTFNGAGLHTSSGAALRKGADVDVATALRIVWASLWNDRAYDEREAAHIDQSAARMGVLVHARFAGEAAQGVAISRNLLDITRSDIYYINAQHGEAAVTNPAPGVSTEQLLYTWPPRTPEITVEAESSLAEGKPVLAASEARAIACALAAIDAHFRPLIDPQGKNRTFAMQVEWKLERGTRLLAIKQARPQPFGNVQVPSDCREF